MQVLFVAPLLRDGAAALAGDVKDSVPVRDAEDPMEVVLVTRGQPGPALWRVTSGHHTLWILGEVSPLWSRIDMQAFELAGMLTSAR